MSACLDPVEIVKKFDKINDMDTEGEDGIGYLSAHPVSVSVKGPCHEHEDNNESENCQLKMFDEVGDDILNDDGYTR